MLPETAFESSGPFEALRVSRPTAAEAAALGLAVDPDSADKVELY